MKTFPSENAWNHAEGEQAYWMQAADARSLWGWSLFGVFVGKPHD